MIKNTEQSKSLKEKIISDLNKEYESTFALHERGLIHYNYWLQQKYAALLIQQDAIKSISEEDYTPQVGDLFEWNGEHFWCIEAGKVSGVVNPINETFYIRGFFWNYGGITSRFIRKATKEEIESLGLKKA
jgi:hypothetical protein